MKRLLQFIGILGLAIAGYIGYKYFTKLQGSADPWAAVPKDAVAVLELENAPGQVEKLNEAQVTGFLQHLNAIDRTQAVLFELDSIMNKSDHSLHDFLGDKKLLVSCHVIDNVFHLAIIMGLSEADGQLDKKLTAAIEGASGFSRTKSSIAGKDYELIRTPSGEMRLYQSGNVMLAFSSDILLKSYIENGPDATFQEANTQHQNSEVETEDTRFIVNLKGLSKVLQSQVSKDDVPAMKALKTFANDVYLDVNLEDEQWGFSGFSHTSASQTSFLACFNGQTAQKFKLADYISNNTLALTYLGVSDPKKLEQNFSQLWYQDSPEITELQDEIEEGAGLAVADLFALLKNEAAFGTTASVVGGFDKYVFWRVNDVVKADALLQKLVDENNPGDSLAVEEFRGMQLRHLGVEDLPRLLIGPFGASFDKTHAVLVDEVIIFANSRQALKLLLDAKEKDEVWGHTLAFRSYLEDHVIESNVSWFVNVPKALAKIDDALNSTGEASLVANKPFIESVDLFTVQFAESGDRFYTNALVQFGHSTPATVQSAPEEVAQVSAWKTSDLINLTFDQPLVTKPMVVKNHVDRSLEVLVVDELNVLTLVSAAGKKLWSYTLDGQLNSQVYQVDVYKNNKLQYLFSTENKVYCIDRLGNDVENFPFTLPKNQKVGTLSLADYDLNKNYRIFLSAENGTLYLYNIEGESLSGWNPNPEKMTSLAGPAQHVRVRGKDFMVAVQKDGKVKCFNRRGAMVNGFPAAVGAEITQADLISVGSSYRKSIIQMVGTKGDLLGMSLTGHPQESVVLPSTDPNTQVQLIPVKGGDGHFGILRDSSGVSLCSIDGASKVKLDHDFTGKAAFQLYKVGSSLVCVGIDQEQNKFWFFDKNGHRIVDEPLGASHELALLFSDGLKKITCYRSVGNNLIVSRLEK